MKETNEIEKIIKQFESAALKHEIASEEGDYKTANKSYKDLQRSTILLKERGMLSSLADLLNHSSVGVRMWAAVYLLNERENDSVMVLQKIADGSGINSLTAKTTLSEWRKGNLKLW